MFYTSSPVSDLFSQVKRPVPRKRLFPEWMLEENKFAQSVQWYVDHGVIFVALPDPETSPQVVTGSALTVIFFVFGDSARVLEEMLFETHCFSLVREGSYQNRMYCVYTLMVDHLLTYNDGIHLIEGILGNLQKSASPVLVQRFRISQEEDGAKFFGLEAGQTFEIFLEEEDEDLGLFDLPLTHYAGKFMEGWYHQNATHPLHEESFPPTQDS